MRNATFRLTLFLACALPGPIVGQAAFARQSRASWTDPDLYAHNLWAHLRDIDHDRDLDLLRPNRIHRFRDSGAFEPGQHYFPPGTGGCWDPGLGDVNGDGNLDLLFTNIISDPLLWLGDGNGGFWDGTHLLLTGGRARSYFVAELADVNGDDSVDAVIASTSTARPIRVLLNDKTGQLVDQPALSLPGFAGNAYQLECADLDNDSDIDFVVGIAGNSVNGVGVAGSRVYLNDGAGQFRIAQEFAAQPLGSLVILGDVDGDDDLDLALFGRTTWQYERAVLYLNDGRANFTLTSGRFPPAAVRVKGGAFADADGDGDLDVVGGYYELLTPPPLGPNRNQAYALWLNDGTGFFTDASHTMPTIPDAEQPYSCEVRAGDIDGDGDDDLFVSTVDISNPVRPEVVWNLQRHLDTPQPARPGQVYELRVWADELHIVAPLLSLAPGRFDFGELGVLQLDPASLFAFPPAIMPQSRLLTYRMPISNDPLWLGQTLHWQAVDVDPQDVSNSRLMAVYRDTVTPP